MEPSELLDAYWAGFRLRLFIPLVIWAVLSGWQMRNWIKSIQDEAVWIPIIGVAAILLFAVFGWWVAAGYGIVALFVLTYWLVGKVKRRDE